MRYLRQMSFLLGLLLVACQVPSSTAQHAELSVSEFASTIATISEPSGFFDSDNYVSNENAYLHIVPKFKELGIEGGVYIGVGPDQNFTYIAKIRPKYAFILDIRRDNLVEHLMFKAIFEMVETRQEYLSILFSKPIQDDIPLSPNPNIKELIDYYDQIPGDEEIYQANLSQIRQRVNTYGLNLTEEDHKSFEKTYSVFFTHHLDIRWEYKTDGSRGISFPAYREFLLAQDLNGTYGSFLNTDDDFTYIKSMQAQNLIIPVTGNFAGDKAIKAIADYTRGRGDVVSTFYLSNVEYYLVPDGLMDAFAENVQTLPITEQSVLIRAFVNLRSKDHPTRVGGHLMTNVLQTIQSFNRLSDEGRYKTYWDVGTADYIK